MKQKHWKTEDIVAMLDSIPAQALALVVNDKNPEFSPAVVNVDQLKAVAEAIQHFQDAVAELHTGQGREFDFPGNVTVGFTGKGLKAVWTGDQDIGKPAMKMLMASLSKRIGGLNVSKMYPTLKKLMENSHGPEDKEDAGETA